MAAIRSRTARRRRSSSAAPIRTSRACWKASWCPTRRCKQVVAHTYEAGLRGDVAVNDGKLDWKFGLFRTDSDERHHQRREHDPGPRRVPERRRHAPPGYRGRRRIPVEGLAGLCQLRFIDATYQFTGDSRRRTTRRPTPTATIHVMPGKRIPGIPRHQFKAGADYVVTPQWKVGA